MRYAEDGVPLVVLAGKEYGSGSSRDWAAKGSQLLGVRAVIAESFERIHRSNLVGMGVLPLEFGAGVSATTLGLTGHEVFRFTGVAALADDGPLPRTIRVFAGDREFETIARDRHAVRARRVPRRRDPAVHLAPAGPDAS